MKLTYEGHLRTGIDTLDHDLRDLEIATLPGGGLALYGANHVNGGLSAFAIDGAGGLAQGLNRLHLPGLAQDVVAGMARVVTIDGTVQAVFGGSAGSGLLGYGIQADGRLGAMDKTLTLADGTAAISDLAAFGIGTVEVIVLADAGTGRLTAYAGGNGGAYRQMAAGPAVGAYADIVVTRVAGGTFVLATDGLTDGLLSCKVTAAGALAPVARMGAQQGIGIGIPTAVETVTAHGKTWVLVGAAGSSSISVMEIDATGALHPSDHVIDSRDTRFADLQAMSVVQAGDLALVIAGGSDDGLSLFLLGAEGKLIHLQSLAHGTGAGLGNIVDIATTMVGDEIQVFVTSGTQGGIAQYDIDLSSLGVVATDTRSGAASLTGTARNDVLTASGSGGRDTLSGGAGDDTLVGGAGDVEMRGGTGADLFAPAYGAHVTRIVDFTAGADRIDLSDFPMLRNPGQLTVTGTATGARIAFGDAVIEVRSSDGRPLALPELFPGGFDWASHFQVGPVGGGTVQPPPPPPPVPPPPPPPPPTDNSGNDTIGGTGAPDLLDGGAGNDTLWGAAGNDTLIGGTGHDRLRGADGADLLRGGDGDDDLDGGNGNDTLIANTGDDLLDGGDGHDELRGGSGDDTLVGGSGDDLLFGEGGRDEIWAGAGDDTLRGGAQGDTLGGSAGNDLVLGEDGWDQLWGDIGNDTLWGGAGNDTLGGGVGRDLLHGEGGNDVVWGGDGDDTQYGNAGDDFVGGFVGNDLLYGNDGNDEIWGNVGDDTLIGGAGNDSLGGGRSQDLLRGGTGNDVLRGSDGHDTLSGEAGDDWLDGGPGYDSIWGGGGADIFHFRGNYGYDRIMDFQDGIDHIRIDQPGLGFGDLWFKQSGANALVATPGGSAFLLVGVQVSDLDPGDFHLG